MQFTPGFGVEYAERTDTNGHGHIAVKLVNNGKDGEHQEFWTDLDRMEEVLRRADVFSQSREDKGATWQTERIGTFKASFAGWPPNNPTDRVAVHLDQTKDGMRQLFTIDTERLKSAVAFGQEVERELGYHQRWNTLVYADSVENRGDGRAQATVFKSVESEYQVNLLLASNKGLALAPDKTRRPLETGDEIELWPDTSIKLSNGYSKSVGELGKDNQLVQEAMGEHFLVARWNDVSRGPREGDRVTWSGNSREYNGKPDDFRARPVGAGEQGEPNEPIYVLIQKGDGRLPGTGTVVAFSPSRQEMVAELDRLEKLQQALTTDWDKQSFKMDRNQYTQGQSM